MLRSALIIGSILVVLSCLAKTALPCSTFVIPNDGKPVFGRNYDWMVERGLVIVNQRNVSKTGMSLENPPTWVSKYGSVTFNQFGREIPLGGMNEAGLVVEVMWLSESAYPPPDERSAVSVLQWVQYQLDVCATVDEVLATDGHLRVESDGSSPVHYLIADRSGHVATVEYLAGRMIVHTGKDLPFPALTNTNYASSLAYLKLHKNFGGKGEIQRRPTSLDRFTCAADMVRKYDAATGRPAVDYAFEILNTVAQGKSTKWSIVYDIAEGRVHFRTHSVSDIRFIDLEKLDFSCGSTVKISDLMAPATGDLTARLVDYELSLNRDLILDVFSRVPFLKDTPKELLEQLAAYPQSMQCTGEKATGTVPGKAK